MEVPAIEYRALVAENQELLQRSKELMELRAAFLANTNKLGIICAKFGISPSLQQTDVNPFFAFACDERLKKEAMLRQELATTKKRLEDLMFKPAPAQAHD